MTRANSSLDAATATMSVNLVAPQVLIAEQAQLIRHVEHSIQRLLGKYGAELGVAPLDRDLDTAVLQWARAFVGVGSLKLEGMYVSKGEMCRPIRGAGFGKLPSCDWPVESVRIRDVNKTRSDHFAVASGLLLLTQRYRDSTLTQPVEFTLALTYQKSKWRVLRHHVSEA
jgi:hypothetical protein